MSVRSEKEKVVVSIGGSVLIPDTDDSAYIVSLSKMIKDLSEKYQMIIVCGGGKTSRYYARTGKDVGGNTYQLDMLGIGATRLNAELLLIALGSFAVDTVPLTIREAMEASKTGKIVVMGGTEPGHTTDAVATMAAVEMGCKRVVNATSVDAVYSNDPKKDPTAKRFMKMMINDLKNIVYSEHGASKSSVFDPLGIKLAKENHIDLFIVNGRDLEELCNAIKGSEIRGTIVSSS